MARGWESKSVESQMEAAEDRQAAREKVQLSEEAVQLTREREALELTRKRVIGDLDRTMNPRYQKQLRAALAHLNEKIAALAHNTQTKES